MIFTVMVLLLTTIALLHFYILKYQAKFKKVDCLPGPPTLPFLGNLFDLGTNIHDSFVNIQNFTKTYGDIVRLWFGPFNFNTIVSKPEYVEYFLSSTEHTNKSLGYEALKSWLGNGLITSNGSHWRKHRKLITPTFHFKILEDFLGHIGSNTKTLIAKLKADIKSNAKIDIYPVINLFALDTICQSAMNYKLDSLNDSNSDYVHAVKVFLKIFMRRFFSMFLRSELLFKWTSMYPRQVKALEILKNFTGSVVKKRREERRQCKTTNASSEPNEYGIKNRLAFLDLLLDIADGADGQVLTDDEIREEVDTFMFAGHDTVSSGISFGLFELAKYPEIQDKLYQESVEILGDDPAATFEFSQIGDFKYLDLVVKEALRINPPVPFFGRRLVEDAQFCGIEQPAGSNVMISVYSMHHDPKLYPDPETFDPERFLPEISAERHPFAFVPFSGGPRNCIGQRFALLEMKTAIMAIVRNFRLRPVVPQHEIKLANDGVLKSLNGLPIILESRF